MQKNAPSKLFSIIYRHLCRGTVRVFYRRFELSGHHNIPLDKGIVLFANHVNALADPLIVQAGMKTLVRPMARSGLFTKPLMGACLRMMGAVPIFRPGDKGSDTKKNKDSFASCYEILAQNECLIIFPEGQSHSDPQLHNLKSGAARLTLGALEANKTAPALIPVGLNFSRMGNFRGDVLVNFGGPIDLDFSPELTPRQTVRKINSRMAQGLRAVTINADSWQDIDAVRRLERFFALRKGKVQRRNLRQKFTSLQRLIDGQTLLRQNVPEKVDKMMHKLHTYERLCQRYGIKDYHLNLDYRFRFVLLQSLRILLLVMVGLPVVLFAYLNNAVPYLATRYLARGMAKGKDQYDTAKILIATLLFSLFWGMQLALVFLYFGIKWMLIYGLALLLSSVIAMKMRGQYRYILDDVKVFFMLLRKQKIKHYLRTKQQEIETGLAQLVRLARHLKSDV